MRDALPAHTVCARFHRAILYVCSPLNDVFIGVGTRGLCPRLIAPRIERDSATVVKRERGLSGRSARMSDRERQPSSRCTAHIGLSRCVHDSRLLVHWLRLTRSLAVDRIFLLHRALNDDPITGRERAISQFQLFLLNLGAFCFYAKPLQSVAARTENGQYE